MESVNEVIICFESVSRAIMAEEALTKQAFNVRVMPVPSGIRGGCGFCLRFSPEDIDRASAFLSECGFDISEAWEKSGTTGTYRKFTIDRTAGGTDGEKR
jgi:fructose-specific phosphotransferase system component IIB